MSPERNFGMKKKLITESKGFAVFALIFGIIGLLLMAHHIVSYDAVLRPRMDYLMANRVITNNISGLTFLRMFTNDANIFVEIYLILFALASFGVKPLKKFVSNEFVRSAIALTIVATGIVYFCVLLPFSKPFPWEKTIWFSNVVNTWNHFITPIFFAIFWFFPTSTKKLPVVRSALIDLIFPIVYLEISIVWGSIDGFYSYPFLNGKQLLAMLFPSMEYTGFKGTIALIIAIAVLAALFFGIACALNKIHNKRTEKYIDAADTAENNAAVAAK